MNVLPAIDLRDGNLVRLVRGDYDCQATYGNDPVAVARTFVQAGAKWIHVVDLDAARTGRHKNLHLVRALCEAVSADSANPAKIQMGGGARDEAGIEAMFQAGVARVVIGSRAISDWPWFEHLGNQPDLAARFALGLDARDGRLAAEGWSKQTSLTAVEIAGRTRGWPLGAIVYTDIARDGMLQGVNVQATAEIVAATDVPVIASGGVSSLQDVADCKRIGCAGAIIGRAWYEGKIDLAKAVQLAEA